MMNKLKNYLLLLSAAFVLYSCGSNQKQSEESEKVKDAPVETAVEEAVPSSVSLTIEGNDQMKYNKDELRVVEGQQVTLTLKHVGEMSIETMGHNWVLLKPGTDIPTFGKAATSAKENDYIPQDKLDQVITHTKTIGGGEETTITFEAPKRGYYTFICSFPGHYSAMQGSFVVEPK
ncbi:MAG: azurin [Cyclobacteriaceae bacterium]